MVTFAHHDRLGIAMKIEMGRCQKNEWLVVCTAL